jgi:hypothetical protein
MTINRLSSLSRERVIRFVCSGLPIFIARASFRDPEMPIPADYTHFRLMVAPKMMPDVVAFKTPP